MTVLHRLGHRIACVVGISLLLVFLTSSAVSAANGSVVYTYDALGRIATTSYDTGVRAKVVGGVARGVGQSVGAMRRATFDEAVSALRHPPGVARAGVSAGPVNGQAALDVSVQVSVGSTRRIGIDYSRRQFVVLDEHAAGMFHGYVRNWGRLTRPMQATLRRAGMVDRRGNIIGGN